MPTANNATVELESVREQLSALNYSIATLVQKTTEMHSTLEKHNELLLGNGSDRALVIRMNNLEIDASKRRKWSGTAMTAVIASVCTLAVEWFKHRIWP